MDYKFSVAMSVYKNDQPNYFKQAMDSIIKQTLTPNEIILVIDGPISDELKNVVDTYENKYSLIKTIWLKENKGLGNALKLAVENAKYDLIARMDSDDIAVCDRFEQQINIFKTNPNVDIVGGDISEFIDVDTNIVGIRKVPKENNEIREYMKIRCALNHVTVMFKKQTVIAAGNYKDWFWNEDYYLWIRMVLINTYFQNTGTTLVKVRVGKEMYKRRGGKKYFISEKKLQDFMYKNKVISLPTYIINVTKRLIVEIILPNSLREWVFKNLARSKN